MDRRRSDGALGLADPSPAGDVPLGGRTASGAQQVPGAVIEPPARALLDWVRADDRVGDLLAMADESLGAQGFTEHGTRHANLVGSISANVLTILGHEPRTAELAAVAGYLHDIGNVVSRANHGQTSGLLCWDLLRDADLSTRELARVMGAVGNHEESYGVAVSPVSAAVILADKSDVHRSRVRKHADIEMDIHDRVNHAVTQSFLRADPEERTLTLELTIDTTISQVVEYFEIFLERMIMCRRAARTLDCRFAIVVNDVPVL